MRNGEEYLESLAKERKTSRLSRMVFTGRVLSLDNELAPEVTRFGRVVCRVGRMLEDSMRLCANRESVFLASEDASDMEGMIGDIEAIDRINGELRRRGSRVNVL